MALEDYGKSWEELEGLRMRKKRLNEYVQTLEEIPQPVELINERYGDEGVVTRDRDLTEDEIREIYDKAATMTSTSTAEEPSEAPPSRKGILKLKCACGCVSKVSDNVIEDGLSWSMIIGNDHYLTLHCPECDSELTLFIEEILDRDELSEEGNKE